MTLKRFFHAVDLFYPKITFFKQFQEHYRRFVGPDLDPNCLQTLSADDKSLSWQG